MELIALGGGGMEFASIVDAISNVGFPIALCVVFGWLVYTMGKNQLDKYKEDIIHIKNEGKEREEALMNEIRENREINAKAIDTIAQYADKLDNIQTDIKEIKQDVSLLMIGGGVREGEVNKPTWS